MNQLKTWLAAASGPEQEELARRAGTSRQYLYKLANSTKGYARTAKAGLAAAIEQATAAMNRESKARLPRVYRTDLNTDCRACPYAQKCLGEAAIASHFVIVAEESGDV